MVRRFLNRPNTALLALILIGSAVQAQLPPDAPWQADATLTEPLLVTIPGIGAGQGVSLYQDRLYFYGDLYRETPRIGVIHEYTTDLKPTGRAIRLTVAGKSIAHHPTGLTWDAKWGCMLGNTVEGKSTILQLDWERALRDGNLDHAVRATYVDDAAVNGGRPCFVQLDSVTLLATADYGDQTPEIRLYDPAALIAAGRTSAAGVVRHRLPAGPFNQNLHWDGRRGVLVCVQNIIAGRGWQLEEVNLAAAVGAGTATAVAVRGPRYRFAPHDELEGFAVLPDGRALLLTSSAEQNLAVGKIAACPPFLSPAGQQAFSRQP